MKRDGSETLTATVAPDDAADKTVTWTSDKPEIATVDQQGAVKAVAVGTATITATAGGKSATCSVTVERSVYVVGYSNSNLSIRKGLLWIDGVVTELPLRDAKSVFVSDGDVYVAGNYVDSEGKTASGVCKNGKLETWGTPGQNVTFNAVAVSGSNVYVAAGTLVQGPSLWKNGVRTDLAGNNKGAATSVFVAGQDIYVAGAVKKASPLLTAASYWKNNVLVQELTDGAKVAYACSIVVSNGDVYLAGYDMTNTAKELRPLYWKNGVQTAFQESGYAYGIAVAENGDVYVCGMTEPERAPVMWKNGEMTALGNSGIANAVCVDGDDVYVVGTNSSNAVLWKNGNAEILPEGYQAMSVFLY